MVKHNITDVMGEINLRKRGGGRSDHLEKMRPPKGSRKFAILRVGKIKGMGQLAAAALHNMRERETLNADPDALSQNRVLVGDGTADDVSQRWHERAPEKIRSNAVHALEYVVTASPEAMAEMGHGASAAYLDDALDWLKGRHGAENILSAAVHEDETTPHLQVLVIPIDERGKLNARGFVGGAAKLRTLQSDFASEVALDYGLERGIEGSKATHTTLKEYYTGINAVENLSLEFPERLTGGLLGRGGETDSEWHERASQAATEALRAATGAMLERMTEVEREASQAADAYTKATEQLEMEAMRQRGPKRALELLVKLNDAEYLEDEDERRQVFVEVAADTCTDRTLPRNGKDLIADKFADWEDHFGANLLQERRTELDLDDGYSL